MSAKTWGLDIGSTGIKAVELARTWQGYRVTNYVFRPVSAAEGEQSRAKKVQELREIFPKGEKGGRGLIVPIPSQRTIVHRVSLPFEDRKKNQQVVKYEVEPLLPFPIDQVIVDFYTPQRSQNGKRALVFAVRKEEVSEQLSLMREAGLDPESLVSEAMALFWLAKQLGLKGSANVLLDLGHEKTTMIVLRGEALSLARSIPTAGWALSRSPEQTSAAALSRLADEVLRTLIIYESDQQSPVENIFLTGGLASLGGLERILCELLKRPVAVLDMERNRPSLLRDVPKDYHNTCAVALGAAFWESARETERINFRQEEFASQKKAQKIKTRMTLFLSYVIILALLGVATLATNLYLKEKRYKDLKAEIRKEFLQAQPGVKKIVSEVQQMKNLVGEEKARVDALGGLASARSPLEILRELSLMIDPAWKVRITELVMDPEVVEVSGEADSFDTVNRLKSKLDGSQLYREVQLKTARASSLENVIEFKFQMKRGI